MDRIYYEVRWNGYSECVYSEEALIKLICDIVNGYGCIDYEVHTFVNGKEV